MLLRNGFFSIMVYLVSRDKSILMLRIHQFAGIAAKTNFAVDEVVVGKIKRNLICSRSIAHVVGACHKCRINFNFSLMVVSFVVKRHDYRGKSRGGS